MKSRYLFILILIAGAASAQKKKNADTQPAESSYQAKVKGLKKFEGFINFFLDEKQDKIFLEVKENQPEFLYVQSLSAGVGSNDIGLDRGQLGSERVVRFERRGPKVLLVEPNLRYRAVSDNMDERRAVEEAFARSVLWGFKVEAEENGTLLVDATDFFLQDAHDVAGTLKSAQQGTYSVDKSRSALFPERIRNFPDNSEFEAILTFTGVPTGGYIRSVTPTPSSVTVRQHHSFVRLPDDQYQPRAFDPRSGYFSMMYYDYATPIDVPIEKRFITRHRLKKKDPSAALSEPVEPIVYYLDRGTPEPVRSALLDGARWWNQAFEAAGYKDAFRVEMLPEGADPMDVRYNVIQWVHRSTRGWSYGASVIDPRTGEIIKGHVSLGSLRVRQDFLIAEGLLAPYEDGKPVSDAMKQMALARLRQLSAHEVGHTLGLAHSYASSTEELASVMDYPHPVVRLESDQILLDKAYDDKIGAWDKVAIAYGYQDFPSGTNERVALNDIIQQGLKKGLTFLSDQDARPQGGAHPYAHLWDNGRDAADELAHVLKVRAHALKNFGENNIRPGAPMAMLEEVLVPVYFFHRYQLEATAKVIGGLNYRYAVRGDGQPVTEWVPAAQQVKALDQLLASIAPETLALPPTLLQKIPPRPIGYSRGRELIKIRTDLTFDPLAAAETASDMALSMLFHPARANRLVEFNSRNASLPSLAAVIDRVLEKTIRSPQRNGYEGAIQMTTNDVMVKNLTGLAASKESSPIVQSVAWQALKNIQDFAVNKSKSTVNETWKSHYSYLAAQIDRFFEDPAEFTPPPALPAPPGQPIGETEYLGCADAR